MSTVNPILTPPIKIPPSIPKILTNVPLTPPLPIPRKGVTPPEPSETPIISSEDGEIPMVSLPNIQEDIQEVKVIILDLQEEIDKLFTRTDNLETENASLKRENELLRGRLSRLEAILGTNSFPSSSSSSSSATPVAKRSPAKFTSYRTKRVTREDIGNIGVDELFRILNNLQKDQTNFKYRSDKKEELETIKNNLAVFRAYRAELRDRT